MHTILLVEDERTLRELVGDYLTRRSGGQWRVLPAADGGEALLLAASQPLDLAILDVMLPDIDGFALCRELRSGSDLPILFLSARSAEEDRLRGYGLGADDYMTKPFSQAELFAKAAALLRRSKGEMGRDLLVSAGSPWTSRPTPPWWTANGWTCPPRSWPFCGFCWRSGPGSAPGGPAAAAVGLGLRGQRPGGGHPREEPAAGPGPLGPLPENRLQNRVQMGGGIVVWI